MAALRGNRDASCILEDDALPDGVPGLGLHVPPGTSLAGATGAFGGPLGAHRPCVVHGDPAQVLWRHPVLAGLVGRAQVGAVEVGVAGRQEDGALRALRQDPDALAAGVEDAAVRRQVLHAGDDLRQERRGLPHQHVAGAGGFGPLQRLAQLLHVLPRVDLDGLVRGLPDLRREPRRPGCQRLHALYDLVELWARRRTGGHQLSFGLERSEPLLAQRDQGEVLALCLQLKREDPVDGLPHDKLRARGPRRVRLRDQGGHAVPLGPVDRVGQVRARLRVGPFSLDLGVGAQRR
mmetsp:Transcript_77037/g.198378  ORF Transcript_77037/g.198378 Transcript_77037/m.198378 type:complete len:292 (-) Transcript_77037:171-1046(-)